MELWVLRENLAVLVNLDHLGSLALQEPREIWEALETREASVFRDLEDLPVNPVYLGRTGRWAHLEKTEATERREGQDLLELRDLLVSLDLEVNLVSTEVQVPQGPRDLVVSQVCRE